MNLKSMTLPELTAVLKELGQPAFRAKQVYTWLHKGVRAYDEMTNLPKSLRDTLAREYPICAPKVVRRQESARDDCYYVDKIRFIPMIEEADKFFFFIRPCRFGKSLTVNMLQHYYDILAKNKFDALFDDLYIGKHPTP